MAAGGLISSTLGGFANLQFGWVKLVIIGSALMLVGGAVLAGYLYVTDLQKSVIQLTANNTVLEANNAQLTNSIETQKETIDVLNAHYDRASEISKNTANELANSRLRINTLEQKLSEHDIGFLSANKPKLVEKVLNNATEDLYRCFEIASGAPLTQEELDATKPSQVNTQCPHLANPNYQEAK